MDKCKEITYCAKELLKTHKIHISDNHKDNVIILISKYIELLIFNIVAVISIICLKIGIKKILSEHILQLSKYVNMRCLSSKSKKKSARMSGGEFNTAAFFGVNEPRYSANNDTSDLLKINFEGNIARNAINMSGGGGSLKVSDCNKLDKIILKRVRNIFKFFNVKYDKDVPEQIKTQYHMFIEDLFHNIKNIKGEITSKKVELLIQKSKIMKKK
jgi:hypothetical protein